MKKTLTPVETGAIAFMIFSMCFGAGNLIFPLRLGYAVGSEMFLSLIGFLITAVGFPVLVIAASSRVGGGLEKLTQNLPHKMAFPLVFLLYALLGPLVATPRTAVVAYDSFTPLVGGGSTLLLIVFSIAFFVLTLAMSINPHRLMDVVGKMVTPLLLLVLAAIVGGALLMPQGPVAAPNDALAGGGALVFFGKGIDEGFQTMNPLGFMVLAVVILKVIEDCGLTDRASIGRSALRSILIAAIGLSVTYAGLTFLGATAHDVAPGAYKGPDIIVPYVQALFGKPGILLLALVVLLACLTTAVGMISACGFYFSKTFPILDYKGWVITCSILGAIVSNIGLGPLLVLSKPVLFAIYPMAMVTVLLNLVPFQFKNPKMVFSISVLTVLPLALIDALRIAKFDVPGALSGFLDALPFASVGLYWLVPGLVGCAIGILLSRQSAISPSA